MTQCARVHITDLGSIVVVRFHRLQKARFMRFTGCLGSGFEEKRITMSFRKTEERGVLYLWSWSEAKQGQQLDGQPPLLRGEY
jgi:hypothetical protein